MEGFRTISGFAGPLGRIVRPDHSIARAITTLEVRRARIPLRQPVVPHAAATLGTRLLIERPRNRRLTCRSHISFTVAPRVNDGRILDGLRKAPLSIELDPVLTICIELVRNS